MVDAFNLLIQLSLAVIGGFIWLKMQPNAKEAASLFPLVCWLLPVLAVFTSSTIFKAGGNLGGSRPSYLSAPISSQRFSSQGW